MIVRTERLLASDNREAMISHADAGKSLQVQPEDIRDFIVLDKITQHLNKNHKGRLTVPIEYVKSCPFGLSFLDNYQHKEKLRAVVSSDTELQKILKESSHAWLDMQRIEEYLPIVPTRGNATPNAKLRLLIEKTINSRVSEEQDTPVTEGWKYLWVPPSLPYYDLHGAYSRGWGFTKSLIFSSWKMVPKMVAGLVSYEAERLTIGDKGSLSGKEAQDEKEHILLLKERPGLSSLLKIQSLLLHRIR